MNVVGFCKSCKQPITRKGWLDKATCRHLPHCPEGKKERGMV